jgi:hypothetical protein
MSIRDYWKLWCEEKIMEAKRKRLMRRPFDYDFLQLLVNEVATNEVEVNIKTSDGSDVMIKRKPSAPKKRDAWSIDLE